MKFKKQKHLLTQREEANAFRVLRPEADLIDFSTLLIKFFSVNMLMVVIPIGLL